jgi:hypothetical protein
MRDCMYMGHVMGGEGGGDLGGVLGVDLGVDLGGDFGGDFGVIWGVIWRVIWGMPGGDARVIQGMSKVNLKTHLKKIMLSLSLYCHVFSVGM